MQHRGKLLKFIENHFGLFRLFDQTDDRLDGSRREVDER